MNITISKHDAKIAAQLLEDGGFYHEARRLLKNLGEDTAKLDAIIAEEME